MTADEAQAFIARVCSRYGVTTTDLLRNRRTPVLVRLRRMIAATLKDAGYSYSQIGAVLNRDHTNALRMSRDVTPKELEEFRRDLDLPVPTPADRYDDKDLSQWRETIWNICAAAPEDREYIWTEAAKRIFKHAPDRQIASGPPREVAALMGWAA